LTRSPSAAYFDIVNIASGGLLNDNHKLGELEQTVMLAVLRLGHDAYGAAIQRELQERIGRDVTIATIYVTLTRLEAKGLVASEFAEGGGARGGRAKRMFRLESEGMEALHRARESLARMWDGLEGSADAARAR
jgi:PadR family transcriptional regulator, regulatory protein PadR